METPITTLAAPVPAPRRRRGLIAGIIGWILDIDDITPEEARERMRSRPGFLASLTPEQLEYFRNYDGPEYLGPPITRRNRRFLLHPEQHEQALRVRKSDSRSSKNGLSLLRRIVERLSSS